MSKFIILLSIITLNLSQRIPLQRIQSTPISNGIATITNLTNFQYQVDLTLGSPIQYTNFVLDTGIGQTWINTIDGHYEVSYSTTANVSANSVSLDYGMGEVKGYQGTELLTISTINNITMPMIFANSVNNTGIEADGVLGLSNDHTYQNPFESYYQNYYKFKLVAVTTGKITNSRFGFYLKNPSTPNIPQFYISSSSFPTTAINWINASMTSYWAIAITSTIVGSTTYPAGTADSQAIIDSGTAMLLIGTTSFNGLTSSQTVQKACQLVNSFYICECPSYTTLIYPNIQFQTANGNLTVVPNNYMLQLSGGYCVMAVDSVHSLTVMLLGDSLMNNYFVAFDKSLNKIGFSSPLATTTTTNNMKFLSK